jgi:hypothetical protein
MSVALVDPVSGSVQPVMGAQGITVPAKGKVYRTVAVGSPDYYQVVMAGVKPFAQFRAYPNPFRRSVTICFMLPRDVGKVEYRLFDAMGRQVWHHVQRSRVQVGMNTLVWDGMVNNGRPAAAGTYVLRAVAFDATGNRLATKERRLVHVR